MKRCYFSTYSILTVALFFLLGPVLAQGLTQSVDINTASVKELQELPFIGKSRAKAIARYRKKHGPFTFLEEIKEIPEIGITTFEAIRPYLTLTGKHESDFPFPDNVIFTADSPKIQTSPGEIIMLPNSEYFDNLVSHIRSAQSNITMTMFLFKTTPSKNNRPSMIVQELIKARQRGVDIHVILDKSDYNKDVSKENKKVARKLRKNNITVLLDSEKKTTHSKIVVIDYRLSFVGSHNLTHSALAYNNELSLLIDSTILANELLQYMGKIH